MKKRLILIGAFTMMLILALWWYRPEQVVKRHSAKLIEMASDSASGVGMFDLNALGDRLDDVVEIEAPFIGMEALSIDRSQILYGYRWMGERAAKSDFSVSDYLAVRVDGDKAEVRMLVKATLETSEMRMLDGDYDVAFGWLRKDGDWKLGSVVWREFDSTAR